MSGPFAHKGFRGLDVKGSVEPDGKGSIVHLTVQNAALAVPMVIGAVLVALLVGAVALDFLPVILYAGPPLILLAIVQYVAVSIRARKGLKLLVPCLECMLSAQRAH